MPTNKHSNTDQETKKITWGSLYKHQVWNTPKSVRKYTGGSYQVLAGESPHPVRAAAASVTAGIVGLTTLFVKPILFDPISSTKNYFSRTPLTESDIKIAQEFFSGELDENKMTIFTTVINRTKKSAKEPQSEASRALKDKINIYLDHNPITDDELPVNDILKLVFKHFVRYIGDTDNRGKNLYNSIAISTADLIEAQERAKPDKTPNRII